MTADLSIRPDHTIRRSPLHDWASTLTGLAPAVTLTERPYLTHTTVWVDPASDAGKAISTGLGVPLPPPPAPSPRAAPSSVTCRCCGWARRSS